MQQQLLAMVEQCFPPQSTTADAEWDQHTPRLADSFVTLTDRLFSDLRVATPGRLFTESVAEHLMSQRAGVVICETRLRPASSYYPETGRAIPTPENPQGPHATGITLSVVLCRGYPGRPSVRNAHLAIELDVWGGYERALFRELMHDHNHAVSALLSSPKLTLTTACPFDNVDAAAKAAAVYKLGLYFDNEQDPENAFTLSHQVNLGDGEGDALAALLRLAAVYDLAMGYCVRPWNRSRVYDYLGLLGVK